MNSYPINLILENKICLVVGGGKIAARKIRNLLKANTTIKVISPKFTEEILNLADSENIELIQKRYDSGDIKNIFLVHAATNDNNLNKQILEDSQKESILTSSIDKNWPYGDFISPASTIHDNTILSVSTNGQHCRKTKFIKNILGEQLKSIQKPELVIIGIDHNSTSFSMLETVQKSAYGSSIDLNEWLSQLSGIYEFSVLKTCNRLEIISIMDYGEKLIEIIKKLPGFNEVKSESIYLIKGFEAFKYLCTLVSGLQSQIIGENHITSQFKKALIDDLSNSPSKVLVSTANLVLQTSKVIRNTLVNRLLLLNLEEIFLKTVKESFTSLKNLKIVVAGTGEMGKSLISVFLETGCDITCLYNKKKPKNLYSIKNIKVGKLSELDRYLPEANILISTLSTKVPFFKEEDLPLFENCKIIFDVGIPRNISSGLQEKLDSHQRYIHFSSLKDQSKEKIITGKELICKAHRLIDNFHEKYNEVSKSYKDWN